MTTRVRHTKRRGFVDQIDGATWWARFNSDVGEFFAEMTEPLPADMGLGSYFTVHRTKRGGAYLYWPRTLLSRRQLKVVRRYARDMSKWLKENAAVTRGEYPSVSDPRGGPNGA